MWLSSRRKTTLGLEWQRASIPSNRASRAGPGTLTIFYIYSCEAHTFFSFIRTTSSAPFHLLRRLAATKASVWKRVQFKGSFNTFANFDEATTKAGEHPSFAVVFSSRQAARQLFDRLFLSPTNQSLFELGSWTSLLRRHAPFVLGVIPMPIPVIHIYAFSAGIFPFWKQNNNDTVIYYGINCMQLPLEKLPMMRKSREFQL